MAIGRTTRSLGLMACLLALGACSINVEGDEGRHYDMYDSHDADMFRNGRRVIIIEQAAENREMAAHMADRILDDARRAGCVTLSVDSDRRLMSRHDHDIDGLRIKLSCPADAAPF